MIRSLEAELAIRKIHAIADSSPDYRGAAIIALASICEGYADNLLRSLIANARSGFNKFGQLLLREVGDNFYSTWDERLKWLCQGFLLADSGGTAIQELRILVDLRNSIVHGNGSLTSHQTRALAKQLPLERQYRSLLGATVEAGKVTLGSRTIPSAKRISVQFIDLLDEGASTIRP